MAATTLSNIPDPPGNGSSLSNNEPLKTNAFSEANGAVDNNGVEAAPANVALEVKVSTAEPNNEFNPNQGFTGELGSFSCFLVS